ncbi:MAG: DUF3987 domain-containing protein [Cyanobacteria bacterium SZAS-4]|nr:DUF3987 domain-containing protein [Cyanobacteria bacterium SZAS-4]
MVDSTSLSREMVDQAPIFEPDESDLKAEQIDWSEPEPIRDELEPVQELTGELLPDALRLHVMDTSHRMQCKPDMVAIPLVVMLGSVIGAGCGIRPKKHDDWLVIPNLWGGIVAPPGRQKTPIFQEVLAPISRIEIAAHGSYEEELETFQIEQEVYEAKRKGLQEDLKKSVKPGSRRQKESSNHSLEEAKQALLNLKAPTPPRAKRLKTNDVTIEKLTELLSQNKRGILVFRDELVGHLQSFERPGHEQDRSFYLEGWNGQGSYTVDRIGRGTLVVTSMCISLLGGIQPDKLGAYLHRAIREHDNDGLLQRLQLLVYPDDRRQWTNVDAAPAQQAREKIQTLVSALVDVDFTIYGASAEGEGPPFFRFDADAQELFYAFLENLENHKLRKLDEHPIIIQHLSKFRSLMPSLALIFHLVDVIESTKPKPFISVKSARLAIDWCEYLESHARRVYGMATSFQKKAAAKLATKIREGALQERFTIREVYRKDWEYLTDKESAQKACDALEDAAWIRRVSISPSQAGGRPTVMYEINPALLKSCTDKTGATDRTQSGDDR